MNRKSTLNLLNFVVALVFLPVGGCEAAQELETEHYVAAVQQALSTSDTLLARVPLSASHVLEIFDLGRGQVGFSEVGTYDTVPTGVVSSKDIERLDPVQVFRKFAPARAIPAKLLQYMERNSDIDWSVGGDSDDAPLENPPLMGYKTAVRPALDNDTGNGGMPGNSCPFSLFRGVSGPLGPFCPADGTGNWCWQNIYWGFYDSNNLTREGLATVCVDAGTAQFKVRIDSIKGNYQSSDPAFNHDFFQPAGTWRQWRSRMGCSGVFEQICDNLKIKFDVPPIEGGAAQFGGRWRRW
jgi:hypothetical protein